MNSQLCKRWLYVFFWVLLIDSTLYIVRPICEFLKEMTPFTLITNGVMGITLLGAGIAFVSSAKKQDFSFLRVMLFFSVISLYLAALWMIKIPEEKIHLIEYGFLSILVLRAMALTCSYRKALVLSFFLTTLFGFVDEGIQHVLPNRYFQMQDIFLNSFSGLMGLFLYSSFDPKPNE